MKPVIYTQRVDIIASYGERRDATDQRVALFLSACGYLPVPMPNAADIVPAFVQAVSPCGILLTGGNSLTKYGGDAPERDATERDLVAWAINEKIPVFGICRGLQFIADYFGATLVPIGNHVRTRHAVTGQINRSSVNSYHTLAVETVPTELSVAARADDGTIEGVCHRDLPLMAVGWHPEREEIFSLQDISLLRNFFAKNKKQDEEGEQ